MKLCSWLVTCLVLMTFLQAGAKESPLFVKRKIKLGSKTITVEVARTPAAQSRGLMFRKSLPKNQGMLFIYSSERRLSFWMKNTLIPLSIGFFDKDKKLLEVQEMVPPQSVMVQTPPSYVSKSPAKYALEMNKGWFKANKIKIGTLFKYIEAK